jgi:hypothetical protein
MSALAVWPVLAVKVSADIGKGGYPMTSPKFYLLYLTGPRIRTGYNPQISKGAEHSISVEIL